MRWTFFSAVLLLSLLPQAARGQTAPFLFESAALGAVGDDPSGANINVTPSQFLAARFTVDAPMVLTGMGGHLICCQYDEKIFLAIVPIGADGFPSAYTLADAVATGLIGAPEPLLSREFVVAVPNIVIPPGRYAIIAGSGLFGATGLGASSGFRDVDFPLASYFIKNSEGWRDGEVYAQRLFVTAVPVLTEAPCAYTFTSGAGPAGMTFCVSETGTLLRLESPNGQEHIDVGQVWEGYIVCSGTTVQSWDLSATADGFGPSVLLAGPSGTAVTIRRFSAQYQLDQTFKLDKLEKDITITMTLTNVSGSTIPDVRLARAFDADANNDFDDDTELRSARGVWAGDVDAITLTGTTWAVGAESAVDTNPSPACSPTGAAGPQVTGDASLANVTYRLGNMGKGAKKKVTFVYRVQ